MDHRYASSKSPHNAKNRKKNNFSTINIALPSRHTSIDTSYTLYDRYIVQLIFFTNLFKSTQKQQSHKI